MHHETEPIYIDESDPNFEANPTGFIEERLAGREAQRLGIPLPKKTAYGSVETSGNINIFDSGQSVIDYEALGRTSTVSYFNSQREAAQAKFMRAFNSGTESDFSGSGVEGDWVLVRDADPGDRRLTSMKGPDGEYIRFNADGTPNPDGELYLTARHAKPGSNGLAGWVDKALGTNFSDLLDNDVMRLLGAHSDVGTFGNYTHVVGGEKYARESDELAGNAFGGDAESWNEYTGYADGLAQAVISIWNPAVGALVAAGDNVVKGGIMESAGYDVGWGDVALNSMLSVGGAAIGGVGGSLIEFGGKYAASGFDSSVIEDAAWGIAAAKAGSSGGGGGVVGSASVRLFQEEVTGEDTSDDMVLDVIKGLS